MTPDRSMGPLRVALAQFRPEKARLDRNLSLIREWIGREAAAHDLLVFPEAATTGYFVEGGVQELALTSETLAARLAPAPEDGPDIIVGFYERWRRRLYNSVAYLTPDGEDGYSVVHVHRKLFLATYGVFDEDRFVECGRDVKAFDTRWGRMGMLVCEDAWHSLPGTVLAVDGAELIAIVSASPARDFGGGGQPGNLREWSALAPAIAREHGVFVVVCQLVGSEGGKLFAGGSLIVSPDGGPLAQGELFGEETVSAALEGEQIDRARFSTPLLADLEQMLPHLSDALNRAGGRGQGAEEDEASDPEPRSEGLGGRGEDRPTPNPGNRAMLNLDTDLVEAALVEFIREEVRGRRGFDRVVIGVSGGVDSAVSLFLACRALGPENVFGFRLPYRTSSSDSLEDAALALEATGAQQRTIEITGAVDAYVETFEPDVTPLRRGNLCARVRAVTLFDQSAKLGALPLGTGNKSERLLGYYTWHADDSPPVNPLGDLFKTQVWALARHLGVPDPIVVKPASADLVQGVHDEDELGIDYARADPILYWLLAGYDRDGLVRGGFPPADVDLVLRRLNSTHWKRELPTVAMLSSSAIGQFYLRPVDY